METHVHLNPPDRKNITYMNIRIFGPLEDITGSSSVTLDDVRDTDDLRERLLKAYPALQDRKFVIAVNNRVVQEALELNDRSEVALLPPFSGG
jgi:molybdopterin synthase sulfur carrier subunit